MEIQTNIEVKKKFKRTLESKISEIPLPKNGITYDNIVYFLIDIIILTIQIPELTKEDRKILALDCLISVIKQKGSIDPSSPFLKKTVPSIIDVFVHIDEGAINFNNGEYICSSCFNL